MKQLMELARARRQSMNSETVLKLRRLRQAIGVRTRIRRAVHRTSYRLRGARVPPVRFVLLFNGRTGSSLLRHTICSHPQLIFEDEHIAHKSAEYQRDWMRSFYLKKRLPSVTTVGFKLKGQDIADPSEFRQLLSECDARVIHMIRHNTVKAAVSWQNMHRLYAATGRWNREAGDAALAPLQVTASELSAAIEHRALLDQQLDEYVRSIDQPRLTLSYEDLQADRDGIIQRVLDFLELPLPERPLSCDLVKNTSEDLREALANFEQLRAKYAGTRFAAMFEDHP